MLEVPRKGSIQALSSISQRTGGTIYKEYRGREKGEVKNPEHSVALDARPLWLALVPLVALLRRGWMRLVILSKGLLGPRRQVEDV